MCVCVYLQPNTSSHLSTDSSRSSNSASRSANGTGSHNSSYTVHTGGGTPLATPNVGESAVHRVHWIWSVSRSHFTLFDCKSLALNVVLCSDQLLCLVSCLVACLVSLLSCYNYSYLIFID